MTDKTEKFENFREILEARHSCRGFLPEQIPQDTITEIVKLAQRVPSWCNAQPWKLIITRGEETGILRDLVFKAATTGTHKPDIPFPDRYTGIYKERRSICGWQLYDAVGVKRGDREASLQQSLQNFKFFGAPHVAVVTSEADLGAYGILDCGAFITAFTLAAEAAGVATIPQAAVAGCAYVLREHFDIPKDRNIVCVISFGLEDKNHPANAFRTERADVSEVVEWRG